MKTTNKNNETMAQTHSRNNGTHRTHFTHLITSPKAAFTLAEVLITLAIIGIVAALTMPTILAKYRQQVALTKLKKAYSEISQAFKMAEVDYGSCESWDYGTAFDGQSAVNFMNKYLAPYLNVVKNCGTDKGCWNGDAYSLSGIKNGTYGDSSVDAAKIIVNSGYTIGITSGGYYVNVQINLNGPKGADKAVMGKELFFGTLNSTTDNGARYKCQFIGHGLWRTEDDIINSENGCSDNGTRGAGMNCLGLIIHDGWKFRDTYPVKF